MRVTMSWSWTSVSLSAFSAPSRSRFWHNTQVTPARSSAPRSCRAMRRDRTCSSCCASVFATVARNLSKSLMPSMAASSCRKSTCRSRVHSGQHTKRQAAVCGRRRTRSIFTWSVASTALNWAMVSRCVSSSL